jgi:hypothetical protein
LVGIPSAIAENAVAFSTKLSNGYTRKKLPDGSFKVETYAFGEGGDWGGARVDASMDRLKFLDVARVIAVPLAARNYMPSRDQNTTDLLIMVYWGTTRAPEHASDTHSLQMAQDAERLQNQAAEATNDALGHQGSPHGNPGDLAVAKINQAAADADFRAALEGVQAEDQRRENDDARTVALLGYDSWWLKTEQASGGGERALRKKDMLDELEEDRYFVVLMASDFLHCDRFHRPSNPRPKYLAHNCRWPEETHLPQDPSRRRSSLLLDCRGARNPMPNPRLGGL